MANRVLFRRLVVVILIFPRKSDATASFENFQKFESKQKKTRLAAPCRLRQRPFVVPRHIRWK